MRVIRARRRSACPLCPRMIVTGQKACLAPLSGRQLWVHLECYLELKDLYVPLTSGKGEQDRP
jgi:hypothetical protein